MGKRYQAIPEKLIDFIQQQKLFFVATATEDSQVNLAPKGMDSLRVIDANRVIWLNVTGSGNETATHVQHSPRMTLMFCAFEGAPMILRLYGKAQVIHQGDDQWQQLYPHFTPLSGARQIFDLEIDLVQSSCGMSVPFFDYVGEREQLSDWAAKKDESGIREFWRDRNQLSIDGKQSLILEKSGIK